ncbi:hypothetical protein SDRG_03588 [Saprolegnia diclina VS20]|uniref:Uncharacterized protein n=1 Tax=Saprolegnia diclina (strain VS20) TaxID=1156394 RepID=T0QXI3_SAPDV|nr:hypothetical protein SDRG_03588 [Saprolegnia diclina VS20]EQC39386.1 hypothetical protein SDRG_03588 [Saprolegnia diclina VS20]|eukprot:XP_008607447.1 hypothetical protein SDRG_03588 [Saprolegnia diclina VS20]
MTSIAPPRETMSLKRTRMMETPFLGDMEVESARSMKRRCFQQEPPHEHDLPKYSQRQFEFLDQAKQAEMSRLRSEFEHIMMSKENELNDLRMERERLRHVCTEQAKEAEKIQAENKLLRRAVTIQNQQKEDATQENNVLKQIATQAAEHIKRLEQTNYALRVHLQASTGSNGSANTFSSDVY